jgi:polyhydroxybutyrate depolymerase
VGPEGLDAGWRNTDGRDMALVKTMLAEFNSKLCIDQQRIFSVGFSFGGMMPDAQHAPNRSLDVARRS